MQKPGGAPPWSESGCMEIHHPLLHEQRGWHWLQGTLWEEVEPEEEQLVEETIVERDVSVGELHTQDHVAFSSVELVNKNGEIVPLLLIDGSAPSSENDENVIDKKIKDEKNENVKSFAIDENEENEEYEKLKIMRLKLTVRKAGSLMLLLLLDPEPYTKPEKEPSMKMILIPKLNYLKML
jgi:hypothetical protein